MLVGDKAPQGEGGGGGKKTVIAHQQVTSLFKTLQLPIYHLWQ